MQIVAGKTWLVHLSESLIWKHSKSQNQDVSIRRPFQQKFSLTIKLLYEELCPVEY